MSAKTRNLQTSGKNGGQSIAQDNPQAPKQTSKVTPKGNKANISTKPNTTGAPSDEDRRKESSRLSQQALAAQRKAQELRQAANGAADPDERQHLMEEAINKQIEAESFGKTAKYLQSGTFQGLAVGTGIGTVPGLTLGTLTGTLVGGTVSLITGGLGGAIGAATGALHGPFWDMGKLVGKGIRKVTGDLPGWKATDKQKATLEKMIGQVNDQEPPSEEDLTSMAQWQSQTPDHGQSQSWAEYGASYLPSMSEKQASKPKKAARSATPRVTEQENVQGTPLHGTRTGQITSQRNSRSLADSGPRKPEQILQPAPHRVQHRLPPGKSDGGSERKQKSSSKPTSTTSPQPRRKPPKLIRQGAIERAKPVSQSQARRTPRKLEIRKGVSSAQSCGNSRALEV